MRKRFKTILIGGNISMDDIVLIAGGLMVVSLFLILGVSELLLSMQGA